MGSDDKNEVVKRMSDLMRSGAVMLDQTCPLCNLPLFKLRSGEVICPVHGPVKIVKSEDEAVEVLTTTVLRELEKVVARRLHNYINAVLKEENLDLSGLRDLIYLLDVLERVRRIKKT